MKNCISYSLFGYGSERHADCYDFNSYLRYFTLVIRMNKLLYPDWEILLNIDRGTYNGFREIFRVLEENKIIRCNIMSHPDPLCKSMLWRLKPVWMGYETVLCRDVDSLACYKERAAVEAWMNKGNKVVHCMTDSVSHNISLMGGMIGVKSGWFQERVGASTWDAMLAQSPRDYSVKGSDQDFLNANILPRVDESITEHYFNGHKQSWRGDCYVGHDIVDNITVESIPADLRETNHLVNHIGQAGFILEPVLKFYERKGVLKGPIWDVEKEYADIFVWIKEIK